MDYPQLVLGEKGELLLFAGGGSENETVTAWMEGKTQDSFNETLSVSGEKYLCSFYKEESASWVSYVEYGAVMGPLGRQRNIFLFVCVVVMALSACVQFVVVKRLYQPIASIREEFSHSRFADGTAKEEFELIRQVYEGAVAVIMCGYRIAGSRVRMITCVCSPAGLRWRRCISQTAPLPPSVQASASV